MDERPNSEVMDSFTRAARILDAAHRSVLPELIATGVSVIDSSNRGGFDMSGYLFPKWCHYYERRCNVGSQIAKAILKVRYDENAEGREIQQLTIQGIAEVFYPGGGSDFSCTWSPWPRVCIADLSADGLAVLIRKHLACAQDLITIHQKQNRFHPDWQSVTME